MRKPYESLDDFIVKPEPAVDPPREVSLRLTGEVETLKPLTFNETSRRGVRRLRPKIRPQPLWFQRMLAVGSGALVMMAFVLISAIIIGISEPGPQVAKFTEPEINKIAVPQLPFDLNILDRSTPQSESIDLIPTDAADAAGVVRPSLRLRSARPRMRLAAERASRQSRPLLELKVVPTTLVIYAENGVVRSRIEPWL